MDLPKGLVTTSTRMPSHLEDPNVIDALDIAQLWKVYHTNPAVHNNDSGHRLENFFWRVWGNERLRCSLQGETLATLFVNIAESQAQKFSSSSSVVKSKSLEKMSSEPTISKVNAQLPPTPPTEENEPDNTTRNLNARSNSDPIPNSNTNTRTPLPPILKKPKSVNGNESSQKKARLLLTGIGGQHVTRKPSNPLTPISPPPFAAAAKEDPNSTTTTTTITTTRTTNDITAITATNTTTNTTTAATTRAQYQYQKKPYLVASKASKRRPVLGRRKSSQTALPRYEAKSDYFGQGDANATTTTNPSPKTTTKTTVGFSRDEDDDLKEQKPVTPADEEGPIDCEKTAQKESSDSENPAPLDQENHQSKQDERTESPNQSQPPDGKYANPDDPNLKNLPSNLVSNLKLLAQKPTTTTITRPNNTKSRPKHIPYPSTTTNTTTHRLTNHERDHLRRLKSSTYIHQLQHQLQQHQQPAKLVDDHFRMRFAEELQREEKFLNAVNSLPEEERSAVLEGHSGRSKAPRIPRTSWIEVPGGGGAGFERDSDTERVQQERPEAATNDNDDGWSFTCEDGGGWAADDAQDHYSDTQVDAVPFKFEGMSYTSSWRAACRLQVPGQLTVLLRAEQYGYRGDAEIMDST